MLKRNGQVASRDDQLSLFDFARSREQANLPDTRWTDRRMAATEFCLTNGSSLDLALNYFTEQFDRAEPNRLSTVFIHRRQKLGLHQHLWAQSKF